jgi:hypothetical protein
VSLIPGNVEVLAFGVQADKATPASAPTMAIALEDNSLDPGVQYVSAAETDSNAVQPDDNVVGAEPGGTFKCYARPSESDFFLYSLLGKNVDTGAGPYTHTQNIDPAAPFASPYLTIWNIWPGIACVKYTGCRIGKAAYTAQPGGMVEAEYTVQAIGATFVNAGSAPSLAGLQVSEEPFTWAELAVSLGGVHDGIVNQFQLMIDRNTGRFVGDNGLSSLDVPNGLLAVSGNLEVAFQDDLLWRAANTGTTSGTALTTAMFEEALAIDLTRGAGLELKFLLAAMRIQNYKTSLKTDGSPASATFDFKSKRSATVSDVIQTVVKNSYATPTTAR